MPGESEETPVERPVVHVLVSEVFFRNRIVDTLHALVLAPQVLDPELDDDEVVESVAGTPARGLVVDLELEGREVTPILERLRKDPRTADWGWICYCSHEQEELVADAARLGLEAVPRSTFASSLVRLLQGFSAPDED